MDIPLFTSHFFRESYCLYPLWNNLRSKKLRLGCKKPHGFVTYRTTHRMRPSPPKKRKKAKHCLFEFWRSLAVAVTHAGTHLLSDGGRNLAIGFLDKINLFFPNIFHICVFVFYGECGCICMISICVADNQL